MSIFVPNELPDLPVGHMAYLEKQKNEWENDLKELKIDELEVENKALMESLFDIRWQTTCNMTIEYINKKYPHMKKWMARGLLQKDGE